MNKELDIFVNVRLISKEFMENVSHLVKITKLESMDNVSVSQDMNK